VAVVPALALLAPLMLIAMSPLKSLCPLAVLISAAFSPLAAASSAAALRPAFLIRPRLTGLARDLRRVFGTVIAGILIGRISAIIGFIEFGIVAGTYRAIIDIIIGVANDGGLLRGLLFEFEVLEIFTEGGVVNFGSPARLAWTTSRGVSSHSIHPKRE
jgi:hypothetical protein